MLLLLLRNVTASDKAAGQIAADSRWHVAHGGSLRVASDSARFMSARNDAVDSAKAPQTPQDDNKTRPAPGLWLPDEASPQDGPAVDALPGSTSQPVIVSTTSMAQEGDLSPTSLAPVSTIPLFTSNVKGENQNTFASSPAKSLTIQESDRNDVSAAVALFGAVGFIIVCYNLTNIDDDDIRRFSWRVFSTSLSVFVSALAVHGVSTWLKAVCHRPILMTCACYLQGFVYIFALHLLVGWFAKRKNPTWASEEIEWVVADARLHNFNCPVPTGSVSNPKTIRSRSHCKDRFNLEVAVRKRPQAEEQARLLRCWATLLTHLSAFGAIRAGCTFVANFCVSPVWALVPLGLNQVFIRSIFLLVRSIMRYSATVPLEPCTNRMPVVGDIVVCRTKSNPFTRVKLHDESREGEWLLQVTVPAVVVQVSPEGDIQLRNPEGVVSAWTFRKNWAYKPKSESRRARVRDLPRMYDQEMREAQRQVTCISQSFLFIIVVAFTMSGMQPREDGGNEPTSNVGTCTLTLFCVGVGFACMAMLLICTSGKLGLPEGLDDSDDAGDEEATVVFQPGGFGLNGDRSTGVVHKVIPGGQAEQSGVCVGWKFTQIDGEPYSCELLDSKRQGNLDYTVTFTKSPQARGAQTLTVLQFTSYVLELNMMCFVWCFLWATRWLVRFQAKFDVHSVAGCSMVAVALSSLAFAILWCLDPIALDGPSSGAFRRKALGTILHALSVMVGLSWERTLQHALTAAMSKTSHPSSWEATWSLIAACMLIPCRGYIQTMSWALENLWASRSEQMAEVEAEAAGGYQGRGPYSVVSRRTRSPSPVRKGQEGKQKAAGAKQMRALTLVALPPSGQSLDDPQMVDLPEKDIGHGVKYTGQWRGSEMHGQGTRVKADGERYEGEFVNSKRHGYGIQIAVDQSTYQGQWHEDQVHGKGKLDHKNNSVYEGEWARGKKNGRGLEVWNDGARYDGEYAEGTKHGIGSYTSATGVQYEGQFGHDAMNGRGLYKFADGRIYMGQFLRGHMTGHGRTDWPDGSSYEGGYEKDVKSGEGTFRWPDGRVYTGQWLNGKMDGAGCITDRHGVPKQARWTNGKLNMAMMKKEANANAQELAELASATVMA